MLKPFPALDDARLLPPVDMARHRYFEHAGAHPLVAGAGDAGLRAAWWLAECALAAYADAVMAARIFAAGGLHIVGDGPVTGADHGGQCYVVEGEGAVIAAFRGTQVVKVADLGVPERLRELADRVLKDVCTDATVRLVPWTGHAGGMVHQGFASSFLEMRGEIARRIAVAKRRQATATVWVTGHSLGGALATLAADCLDGVDGVHVFGSPRVGDRAFAAAARFPGWRFHNQADIVPWLPLETMGFRHVPPGRYLDRNNAPGDEPGALAMLRDAALGTPAALRQAMAALGRGEWGALTPRNLVDHSPLVYAIRVWNAYAGGHWGAPRRARRDP